MDLKQRHRTEKRLRLFEHEVEEWKRDHDEAMECFDLERTLCLGIFIYDTLIKLDEEVRVGFLKGTAPFDPQYEKDIEALFEWWLKPCEAVEEKLRKFIARFGSVDRAEEFRKRHAEAKWAKMPLGEIVDHPKMVELRDKAIDDLRAGKLNED